ncbi:hypothetical protein [Streptomyces profundus]|uniref:hypothetical protein n=1 Tax=Streptomyces profundus TaxID=2867410 RepID=UPI001D161AB5|nr:hypothetical protein [Streptomyces sp. MA3_2.13]UED84652.1 hypothetical protein K4G22_10885 [Streptomyces sp. MA3_2.13]
MRFTLRAAAGIAGVALLAGTAACGSEDNSSEGGGDERTVSDAASALQAAAETTSGMTSARFEGQITGPAAAGGDMTMEGVMSWESSLVMEMTAHSDELAATPGAPPEMTIRWLDNVMYMNMGEEFASEMDGRSWLSMDLAALAEESGDQAIADALTMGLESTNQDPAQQMGIMLQSPGIEEVGEETLDGVETRHFQGTVTVEDAIAGDAAGTAAGLTDAELEQLVDMMEQQGIESYEIDVWIDENDLPVQITQSYDTNEGPVENQVRYFDYNTDVTVEAPPADSVFDFMDLLAEMGAV